MTVNKRLYVAGLMDRYDRAVKDKRRIAEILRDVELHEESITAILQSLNLS